MTSAEELFRQVAASYMNVTDSRRHDERRKAIAWAAGEIAALRTENERMRAAVREVLAQEMPHECFHPELHGLLAAREHTAGEA